MSLEDLKVEIFPDINDQPRTATANQAGNGADLINRFNALVDQLSPRALKDFDKWGDADIYLDLSSPSTSGSGLDQNNPITNM